MTKLQGRLQVIGVMLAWAAALGGCKPSEDSTDGGEASVRSIPVEVLTVGRGTVREVVRHVGEVRPSAQVNVLPRMAERIVALHFEEGDWMEGPADPRATSQEAAASGATLMAELSKALVDTGVQQAQAGVGAISAQIEGLRTQQARLRRLLAEGIIPQSQLDPVDAQIRALQAQRSQVSAGVSQANLRMDDTLIYAPMSGFVSRRYAELGDLASPAVPVATIVRLDPVHIWLDVPEYELESVRAQPRITLTVDSAPGRLFEGALELVSPSVDRESRSVRLRYRVANPDRILRDGMLANVNVELQRHDGVLVVPAAALELNVAHAGEAASYAAYTTDGKTAKKVTVTVGLADGSWLEVLSGLAEGDRLVVAGHHLLEDGTAVDVVGTQEGWRPPAEEPGAAAAAGDAGGTGAPPDAAAPDAGTDGTAGDARP